MDGSGVQEFELGDAPDFSSCHHPAWNRWGDRIICTRHYKAETRLSGDTEYNLRMLYEFLPSTLGNWTSPSGHLFSPLSPNDLHERWPDIYPTSSKKLIYTYKFAEWCGSDDFVVATLFVSREDQTILCSRVLLIRIAENGVTLDDPEYHDLTSRVEDTLSLERGVVQGVYSTCSRRRFHPAELVRG